MTTLSIQLLFFEESGHRRFGFVWYGAFILTFSQYHMMLRLLILLLVSLAIVHGQAWTPKDDPFRTFDRSFSPTFSDLPLAGSLKRVTLLLL